MKKAAVPRARPLLPQDDAILATNTSTLPVVELAVETERPERVCGIHFFNPAPVMSLVEIVRPLTASDETIAAGRDVRRARAARTPVEVEDRAGFIVNALLFPYLNNAVRMLENGTASPRRHRRRHEGRLQLPDGPVRAARPRRPRHVARHPRRARTTSSATRTTRRCRLLRRMVTAGQLGRKSGYGFYDYRK